MDSKYEKFKLDNYLDVYGLEDTSSLRVFDYIFGNIFKIIADKGSDKLIRHIIDTFPYRNECMPLF